MNVKASARLVLMMLCIHACLCAPALQLIEFKDPPILGATAKVNPRNPSQQARSESILFGGMSGITYDGLENSGKGFLFKINTDRGPTPDAVSSIPQTQGAARPFALPEFVPRIVSVLVNFQDGTAIIYEDISLFQGDGRNITGLPNLQHSTQNLSYTDEFGVDLFGNILTNDPEGADLEGIVQAADGTYWLADEYRPSLYHFDHNGKLLKRYIPIGAATDGGLYGVPILPAVYAQRRLGRGFEGIAIQGTIVYAFMQSPLDNPNAPNNYVSAHSSNIRILAFDTVKENVVAEYVYVLSEGVHLNGTSKVDKIGDVTSLGNGKFLVIEQDSRSGPDAFKVIYEVDISQATDIHNPVNVVLPPNVTIEQATFDSNLKMNAVRKTFIVNLAQLGFDFEKVEGLTVINATSVVVVNDNDFQLIPSEFYGNGSIFLDRTHSTYLGLVTGLNFTSSFVTTSTTFNPTTTGSTTGGTTGGVTTGRVSTTGNSSTTASTSSSTSTSTTRGTTTKGSTSTTNSSSSVAVGLIQLLLCILAVAFL